MAEKKKKVWPGVLFTILTIIVIVVIVAPFFIDGILKTTIEKTATDKLGVAVSVEKVHLNIVNGNIAIQNLQISNPEGYEFEHILTADTIEVTADLGSFFTDTIKIDQILLKGPSIVVEQKIITTNLNDIIKSIKKKNKAEKKAESQSEKPAAKGKNLYVSVIDIKDINVKAKLLPIPGKDDTAELKIEKIHIADVGKGGKTTAADIAEIIFTEIAYAITTQGPGMIPVTVLDQIQKSTGLPVKDIEKGIEKKVEDVTNQLKGLFDKKTNE